MKKNISYTIRNQRTNKVIAKSIKHANTFFSRLKGLLGSEPLKYHEGLLISPCQQIHTHFMAYPIDVIFMNRDFEVIEVIHELKPWKLSKFHKSSYYVLEIPAKAAFNTMPTDKLMLVQND